MMNTCLIISFLKVKHLLRLLVKSITFVLSHKYISGMILLVVFPVGSSIRCGHSYLGGGWKCTHTSFVIECWQTWTCFCKH